MPDALRDARSLLVIRALPGLGDMLCVVPTLRSLRAAVPDAALSVLGIAPGQWLVDRYPDLVGGWLDLPHWPSIPEATGSREATRALLAAHGGRFDLVLQCQGSGGPINRLAALLARRTAAVHVTDDGPPRLDAAGPQVVARPWPTTGHESERLLGLVRELGLPARRAQLEFPVRPADRRALSARLGHDGGCTAVVHPGASRPDRRWSSAGFGGVVTALRTRGLDVLLTGTAPEAEVLDAVDAASGAPVPRMLDLPLGELAALLERARLVVSNDTGVAHLSIAVGSPTLVVGTTSDLERWGPQDRVRNGVVATAGSACHEVGDDVHRVVAEVERLLAR